jgi:hypothetical protein
MKHAEHCKKFFTSETMRKWEIGEIQTKSRWKPDKQQLFSEVHI